MSLMGELLSLILRHYRFLKVLLPDNFLHFYIPIQLHPISKYLLKLFVIRSGVGGSQPSRLKFKSCFLLNDYRFRKHLLFNANDGSVQYAKVFFFVDLHAHHIKNWHP
jgi:hypothetical protein